LPRSNFTVSEAPLHVPPRTPRPWSPSPLTSWCCSHCLGCCGEGRSGQQNPKCVCSTHLFCTLHYMRDIPSPAPHLVCQSVALLLCRCGEAKVCCARPFQLFDRFAVTFLVRNSVPCPRTCPLSEHRLKCRGVLTPSAGVLRGGGCRQQQRSGGGSTESRRSLGPFYMCSKRNPWGVSDACRTSYGPHSETQMKVEYGPL
jgi:hypothetical protein